MFMVAVSFWFGLFVGLGLFTVGLAVGLCLVVLVGLRLVDVV